MPYIAKLLPNILLQQVLRTSGGQTRPEAAQAVVGQARPKGSQAAAGQACPKTAKAAVG